MRENLKFKRCPSIMKTYGYNFHSIVTEAVFRDVEIGLVCWHILKECEGLCSILLFSD